MPDAVERQSSLLGGKLYLWVSVDGRLTLVPHPGRDALPTKGGK